VIALGALAALAGTVPAGAGPQKPEPKPPKLTLLTETEAGALRREAIKVGVESRRGKRASVEAQLVIDGYPEDYPFHLGPEHERLKRGEATVRFKLSARQREVLDFAITSCHGATIDLTATVNGRTGRLFASLKTPPDC
jgi:hypothetical protein